ncbi:MAG: hypothetical protein EAZ99_01425 [Alphaproteobacteria bacterium]|nr:MAG: hypothetical protein EAZ99_01425 [Alphaproteobacteria bacterium]
MAWWFRRGIEVRWAVTFGYAGLLIVLGLTIGMGPFASAVGTVVMFGLIAVGWYGMLAARRQAWRTPEMEQVWLSLAWLSGAMATTLFVLIVLVPALIAGVLLLWALVALPLWLFRQ